MAIKPKMVVQYRLDASCPTHARTDVSVRDVSTTVDEPRERGGTNQGPTPTEMPLAGLAGCTNVIGNRVAQSMGLDLGEVAITVEADFDRHGVTMQKEIDVPFPRVVVTVEISNAIDDGRLAELAVEVEKYCPLSKLFSQAGTDITTRWVVRGS